MKKITIFTTYEVEDTSEIEESVKYKASSILIELKDGMTIQNVLDAHNEKVGAIERKLLKNETN